MSRDAPAYPLDALLYAGNGDQQLLWVRLKKRTCFLGQAYLRAHRSREPNLNRKGIP